MNEFLTLGQLNEQVIQREKALKAAASCTPKKAIYIPATESARKRELRSAPTIHEWRSLRSRRELKRYWMKAKLFQK